MRLTVEAAHVDCPYCGEPMELNIDASVDEQEYVEDCWVCCRPIVIQATVVGDDVFVAVQENE